MAKYRVQGEYTYTVFKIVEADNEEQAKAIAQDNEPLCTWDCVEKNSYFEHVENATETWKEANE
tara:strand:- start:966 stop:1157 length:192 start_codon:yes stop_codon:yes gene_type:complete